MAEAPVRGGPTTITATALLAAGTTIHTAPSSGWGLVRSIVFTHLDTAGTNVALWVGVGANNTDAVAKRVIHGVLVQPGVPYVFDALLPLAPNEVVYAITNEASKLNATVGALTGP